MKTNEEYKLLEQQLAEREKQIVELRNSLEYAQWGDYSAPDNDDCCPECGNLKRQWHALSCAIGKALDATQDLKNCIICDAEPVGSVSKDCNGFPWKKIDYINERLLSELPIGAKLYKARKP
jgi:hypothetical protein